MQTWKKVSLSKILKTTKEEIYTYYRNKSIRFLPIYITYFVITVLLIKFAFIVL